MAQSAALPKAKEKEFLARLAAKGRGQDSIIAHINPREAALLKRMGGKGTPNPKTGLLEFDGGGGEAFSPGDPTQSIINPSPYTDPSAGVTIDPGIQAQIYQAQPGNQGAAAINDLTYAVGQNPSLFTQGADGSYTPTPDYLNQTLGYNSSHYHPGGTFLQNIEKGLGSTGIGPILPILGVAGAGLGLGAAGLLGGVAADAGAGAVDAFGIPLAQGAGLTDLTGQLAAAGSPALTAAADVPSVASIGDAGFTAGLSASDPAFAANFGSLVPDAAGAAGAAGGALNAGGTGGGLADLTGQVQAASPDALGGVGSSSLASPFDAFSSAFPTDSFTGATTATDVTGAAGPGVIDVGSGSAPIATQPLAAGVDTGAWSLPDAGAGTAASGAGSSWLDSIFGTGGSGGGFLGGLGQVAKVASPIIGGASLASSLMNQNKAYSGNANTLPQGQALQSQANTLNNIGTQLTAPLLTGSALPPGAQAGVDQAKQAEKAHVKSQFASAGMSGSSEETTALNQIDAQSANQTFQIAQSLATQGIGAIGGANSVYSGLMSAQLQQDAALQKAIANFSSALAGGTRTNYASNPNAGL